MIVMVLMLVIMRIMLHNGNNDRPLDESDVLMLPSSVVSQRLSSLQVVVRGWGGVMIILLVLLLLVASIYYYFYDYTYYYYYCYYY